MVTLFLEKVPVAASPKNDVLIGYELKKNSVPAPISRLARLYNANDSNDANSNSIICNASLDSPTSCLNSFFEMSGNRVLIA